MVSKVGGPKCWNEQTSKSDNLKFHCLAKKWGAGVDGPERVIINNSKTGYSFKDKREGGIVFHFF